MNPAPDLHVVVGAGPVGRAVIDELTTRDLPLRVVARQRPSDLPATVEFQAADITDQDAARGAMAGATIVYHAASAPYDRWPELLPPLMHGVIAGATAAGARIVYADNLYAYGPVSGPLTEDLPAAAQGPNGRVRAELADLLLRADATGSVRATIGRASDYYGPRGRRSQAGERLFASVLAGKAAQLLGDPDMPHTYTHLADFARGLVTLGTNEASVGEVWHLPSAETLTSRAFVELVCKVAGEPTRLSVTPSWLLALLATVNPTIRAVREQRFQVEQPWVVDHSRFARAFGVRVTPHPDAIRATLDWFAGSGG